MRVLVALGGNALLKRGEPMTAEVQRENVRVAAKALAPVCSAHQLVLSHGNGPQVGLLALQASAYKEVEAYPLDVLGAQTEGMIGYLIEQELGNLLPAEVPIATILRPPPLRGGRCRGPCSASPSTSRTSCRSWSRSRDSHRRTARSAPRIAPTGHWR